MLILITSRYHIRVLFYNIKTLYLPPTFSKLQHQCTQGPSQTLSFRTYSAPAFTPHTQLHSPHLLTHQQPHKPTSYKMGTISIRKFIRWLPDEPSEPTTTLVITSPRLKRFVDLRILLPKSDSDSWTGQDGKHFMSYFFDHN